jgi:hypothetical protein
MTASLRDLCEESIRAFRSSGVVEQDEVGRTWDQFLRNPEERVWSAAFLMCVVGHYIARAQQTPVRAQPASVPSL